MARILIVDDEEMDRVLERSILEDEGHELLFAADGEAALRVYRDREVDLVVTDLAMPHVNGLQLIRRLRELDPDVRILAVSGVSPEQLPLAEDLGAAGTLFKPLDRNDLVAAVDRLLEGKEVSWEEMWGP